MATGASSPKPSTGEKKANPPPPTTFAPILRVKYLALSIFAFYASLAALFAAYVWSRKVYQLHSTIWVAIPNNNILLISTIFSRIPGYLVSSVMGLTAYGFATDWLASSAVASQDIQDNPTPEQYSIALSVIGVASPSAILNAALYFFRHRHELSTLRSPQWLIKSIIFLVLLTSLSSLIGIIDLWLHNVVLPVRLTTFTTASTPTSNFSRAINSTLSSQKPGFYGGPEFEYALANESRLNEVYILPDTSIALLIPTANLRSNYTYKARTFGAHTTCAPVSSECGMWKDPSTYACMEYPGLFGSLQSLIGDTSRWMSAGQPWRIPKSAYQPLTMAISAAFQNIGNSSDSQLVYFNIYMALILCELTFVNVTYLHQPRRAAPIQIESYTQTNLNDTSVLSNGMSAGQSNSYIDPYVVPSIVNTNVTVYAFTYAQQLSRLAISYAAGIMIPSRSLVDYPSKPDVRGAQIPLPAFITFLVSMLLFAFCILAVVGLSGSSVGPFLGDADKPPRTAQAVALAQSRLTGSGPVIYEMFCFDKSRRAGCTNLFGEDGPVYGDYGRLRVGVVDKDRQGTTLPEGHFGISTAVTRSMDSARGAIVA